jgi:hypothetical protein
MNEWRANISEQTLKFNQVKERNCGQSFLIINVLLEMFFKRKLFILKIKVDFQR